jgi:hypothetical protein
MMLSEFISRLQALKSELKEDRMVLFDHPSLDQAKGYPAVKAIHVQHGRIVIETE